MIRSIRRPAAWLLALLLAVLLAAFLVTAPPAPATAGMLGADDPEGIARALGQAGAPAELQQAPDGSPLIVSSAAGLNYVLYFHGCTDGAGCTSLKFAVVVSFEVPPDPAAVNDWNRTTRYGKAHVGAEGELRMEYDISTVGGLPPEGFSAALAIWEELLGRLRRTIAG
ncbi:MAG: YbjN domain-containing protein [Gemmobacter sp.]